MVLIRRYEKATGKRAVQTRETEAEAIDFINSLLTNYEKQKTQELINQARLTDNGFYSKKYFYYIIEL